jgi:hypothetical protein
LKTNLKRRGVIFSGSDLSRGERGTIICRRTLSAAPYVIHQRSCVASANLICNLRGTWHSLVCKSVITMLARLWPGFTSLYHLYRKKMNLNYLEGKRASADLRNCEEGRGNRLQSIAVIKLRGDLRNKVFCFRFNTVHMQSSGA